jgi:hypothetical protein
MLYPEQFYLSNTCQIIAGFVVKRHNRKIHTNVPDRRKSDNVSCYTPDPKGVF